MANHIAEFLKKALTFKPQNKEVQTTTQVIILEICNINVALDEIVVNKENVFLKTHPTIKNLVFINKNEIISKINNKLTNRKIKTIL